jgi:hypothetical protein
MTCDALIVGARVAGATLALLLACQAPEAPEMAAVAG